MLTDLVQFFLHLLNGLSADRGSAWDPDGASADRGAAWDPNG
jgi:hypothetical protein